MKTMTYAHLRADDDVRVEQRFGSERVYFALDLGDALTVFLDLADLERLRDAATAALDAS